MLRVERRLRDQLDRLHARLEETRADLGVSADQVKAVVDVGLALAELEPLVEQKVPGRRPGESALAWQLPPLPGSWAICAEGIPHPHTQTIRPVVFDHGLAVGRDDLVLVHLGHPLVQRCLRLLRSEVWAPPERRKLSRVSVRVVPHDALDHPVVAAHARLVILGGDQGRLHEELIQAGGMLRSGRFRRLNLGELSSALSSAKRGDVAAASESLKARIRDLWPSHRDALVASLCARMKAQVQGLLATLDERAAREAEQIRYVLEELRQTILAEVHAAKPEQFELWAKPEQEQLERNRSALTERAEAIPAEIAREQEAVRRRYQNPEPRLFPVAVTYFVPEGLANGR